MKKLAHINMGQKSIGNKHPGFYMDKYSNFNTAVLRLTTITSFCVYELLAPSTCVNLTYTLKQ